MLNLRTTLLGAVSLLTFSAASLLACGESTSDPSAGADASPADASFDSTGSMNDAPLADAGVDRAVDASDGASAAVDAAAQEQLICDALASRSACPSGAIACEEDDRCIYGRLMLPAAAAVYASCRAAPSCKGDDQCVAEAGQSVGGAASNTYGTNCVARRSTCANAFEDDFCSPALFAYPGAGTAAQACLAEACNQIDSCLQNIPVIKDLAACK